MKFITGLFFLLLLTSIQTLSAQLQEPVRWETTVKQVPAVKQEPAIQQEEGGQLLLIIRATLEDGWHLYSQHIPDGGPQATTISLTVSDGEKDFIAIPWAEMGEAEMVYDSSFHMSLTYYSKTVSFIAALPQGWEGTTLTGSISYMVCDSQFCLPPTEELLNFSLGNRADMSYATPAELEALSRMEPPVEPIKSASVVENQPAKSIWSIFFTAFLGGLAALLTPCVFPIIPLTVSYFTKRSSSRAKGIANAFIYGLSIILIYVSLGWGVSMLFGIDALNALATNVWVNLLFFVLLVVFAISFLGGFEIQLPAAFVNKVDAQSDRGGLLGIFFMAFTLALVSFSCTGPIIGTLLFESAVSGNMQGPLIGMTGFSLALALPFGFFAAFPGWLKSLPKSGSWMNSIKVVLGLLELALALKFLSNADLVLQAGILSREIFLALWIAIFGVLSLYLLGFVRFPHDSPTNTPISVFRALSAVLTLAFTLYLIPGLWGAPLKLISGFPPPDFYKEWKQSPPSAAVTSAGLKDEQHGENCPNGLDCFHEYEPALAYAKQTGKPLLLDFTGWACVNCRKMESLVWTDPEVAKRLQQEVVLVSLYVDDKRELPKAEQSTEMLGGKEFRIKTIGNKWSHFQAERFQINSQPYYVLMDASEQVLEVFAGYNPSAEAYLRFLDAAREEHSAVN